MSRQAYVEGAGANGHSSPVFSGGKIFLTGVVEGRPATLAFDAASGKRLWLRRTPEVPLERVHQANSHAAPTPVVNADRLFVYFGSFGLICYDHAGKELWKKKLPVPRTLYGTSSSPISYGSSSFWFWMMITIYCAAD